MCTKIRFVTLVGVLLASCFLLSPLSAQCQLQQLNASDAAAFDQFGEAVAIAGDVAVVGVWHDDDAGLDSGSVYVYRFDGTLWSEEAKLAASDAASFDEFGFAVAIDGDVIVVGASGDDDDGARSGAAYVFRYNGLTWNQEAKLTAADADSGDQFGRAVAVSGDLIVVGADQDDDVAVDSGSAYIFRRSGALWSQESKLNGSNVSADAGFGSSVALSGSVALVAAADDDEISVDAGAVYAFRHGGGVLWNLEAKLFASDGFTGDRFGAAVDLDGDLALVGAPQEDSAGSDAGSAYLFRFVSSLWTEEMKLVANDATIGDAFGSAVAVGPALVLVGSPFQGTVVADAGSAYTFRDNGGNWVQEPRLEASAAASEDRFGGAVALDGNRAIIAAAGDDEGFDLSGSAFLFSVDNDCNGNDIPDDCDIADGVALDCNLNGTPDACDIAAGMSDCNGNGVPDECDIASGTSFDCNQNGVPDSCDIDFEISSDCDNDGVPDECPGQKLTALTSAAGDLYGEAVAADGELALVGAPGSDELAADTGAAIVLRRSAGVWSEETRLVASDGSAGDAFGSAVAIAGAVAVVGAPEDDDAASGAGSAYVYRFDGTDWVEEAELFASDAAADDEFGGAVGISGDRIVIGARRDDDNGLDSGAVYVFRLQTGSWVEEFKLTASDAVLGDFFGESVAISGDRIAVGAWRADGAGSNSGSCYVFQFDGSTWLESELTAPGADAGDHFGYSVAISGDLIVVGARGDDDIAANAGAAYVYRFDGSSWLLEEKLTAADGVTVDSLGEAVAIAGDTVLLGAALADPAGISSGAVYAFRYDGLGWLLNSTLRPVDGAAGDLFGSSVAVALGDAWIGAPNDDDGAADAGSAYYRALPAQVTQDCNGNGEHDRCDIEAGFSVDCDGNGIPDECEIAAPEITSQPLAVDACAGDLVELVVAALGADPLGFQWRRDGVDLGGETSPTLTLPGIALDAAGSYDVVVTNICDSVLSDVALVTVTEAPTITSHPTGATLCEGLPVTFTVAASGTAPFDFQWRHNGVAIDGATGATFTLNAVTASDAGAYDAIVSNACGAPVSAAAELVVEVAPVIDNEPQATLACLGSAAAFAVAASGTEPLSYQWRRDGVDLAGATDSTLHLSNVSEADAALYDVIVSNGCGSATSVAVTLGVDLPPTIEVAPSAQTVCLGGSTTFTVFATGTAPLSFQWRRDGVAIPGATGGSFNISGIAVADAGTYDVVVSNVCDSVTSAAAVLTVDTPPTVVTSPLTQFVCEGDPLTLAVIATGTPTLTYQWRRDGADLPGETAPTLSFASAAVSDAGSYDVLISNHCGSSSSTPAVVTVGTAPSVVTAPTAITSCLGTSAAFGVVPGGSAPHTFQWRKDGVAIEGATSSSLTMIAVALADAGSYDVVIDNACGSVVSAAAPLTVTSAPAVTLAPADSFLCPGDDLSLTVIASGTAPLGYQWRRDGVDLPGETSATLSVNGVAAASAGAYDVVISNSCGSATSASAAVTVGEVPAIVSQPLDQLGICLGGNAIFGVTASGSEPLSFQWRFNGVAITGATGPTFLMPAVGRADAGVYSVDVSNSCGSASSVPATLTVFDAPEIILEPVAQTLCEGGDVTFASAATGSQPLSFQWRRNGAEIFGATDPTLTLAAVNAQQGGDYDLVVSNNCGSAISASAELVVAVAPTITVDPQAQSVCIGTPVTFTADATGTAPLTFQWRRNGTLLIGETGPSLALGAVDLADTATYDVVVTNNCGSAFSQPAPLEVGEAPNIVFSPQSQSVCEGSSVTLSVAATGTNLLFEWRRDGVLVPGANSGALTFSPVAVADSGSYEVTVSNNCGGVAASAALLTVQRAPEITLDPAAQTICAGSPVTFSVEASGTEPLSYQWRRDGVPISGATTPDYSIASVNPSDAASYDVIVANGCGSPVSLSATLDVEVPPQLTLQPVAQVVCEGNTVTLNTAAIGSAPLLFQWRRDGNDIVGANGSSLTLNAVTPAEAGSYDVVVSNNCEALTSVAVDVDVEVVPAITQQPLSRNTCLGGVSSFTVVASGSAPFSYQWRFNGAALAGETGATLIITDTAPADAGLYDVAVSNNCGFVNSAAAELTVDLPPVLVTQPQSETVCLGNSVTFGVNAGGTAPLSYQWRFQGAAIAGATSNTFTIDQATAADAGAYDCEVSNLCATVLTGSATLTVDLPPVIVMEPTSQQLCAGDDLTLMASANGTAPMSYQWRRDGVAIPGATLPILSITDVNPIDSGSYDLVASNRCDSVTTTPAQVTVLTPALITAQPTALQVCLGESATFSVDATGSAPISYQWRRNGADIFGATGSSYTIDSTLAAQAGSYDVVVSNSCAQPVSVAAELIVDLPPTITLSPQTTAVCLGASVTLAADASGTEPLDFQWRYQGAPIAGATGAALTLTNVALGDAGSYDVVVSNSCDSATSAAATLFVQEAPAFLVEPTPAAICVGAAATLAVLVDGADPIDYQWRRDGADVPGATSDTLVFGAVTEAEGGVYDCVVSNACGTVISASAALDVGVPPTITALPNRTFVCEGEDTVLTVVASGTDPFTYQWRHNGVDIAGATANALDIVAASATDAGSYDVIIGNSCGATISASAIVTVGRTPTIVAEPLDVSGACAGETVAFSVIADGSEPLSYQWRLDGSDLVGATADTLTILSVGASDAGVYDVVIDSPCGQLVSASATLSVEQPPQILTQPTRQDVCEGMPIFLEVVAGGSVPLTVQWQKDGVDVPGATAMVLAIPASVRADSGSYQVTISNPCGSEISGVAEVTVDTLAQCDCNGNGVDDDIDVLDGTSNDCNGNGRPDECDIADGLLTDVNGNGVADDCENLFIRGDTNGDGQILLADVIFDLVYQFAFGPVLCLDAHDTNDDGIVNLTDPIASLNYLFNFGTPPVAPFPTCGLDSTVDGNAELGCDTYDTCP